MLVGTHDGHFHCDDVMCHAILSLLFDDLELIRTRDTAVLEKCDILFDVGEKIDIARRVFDHHFVGSPIRPNGVPYASAGLIWQFYGIDLLKKKLSNRTELELDEIHRRIDKNIMQSIDAHDTYYSPGHYSDHYTLPQVISSYLPQWQNFELMDERFLDASKVSSQILDNNIRYLDSLFEADKYILEEYEKTDDSRVLVLDRFIPFESSISRNGLNVEAVVYRAKENEWLVQSVSRGLEGRKLFPTGWAGKKDSCLDKVSEIEGGIFCHPDRFAAGHSTRKGAIRMAKVLINS